MNTEPKKKKNDEVEIVVNGTDKTVPKGNISYKEVIILAFGTYESSPLIAYTVTYFKGNVNKPKGTLVEGQTVKVKKGMIFNVTRTDKS